MRAALIVRCTAALLLAMVGLALAQSAKPLTNDDVIKMTKAQLSARIILTTIDAAEAVLFE